MFFGEETFFQSRDTGVRDGEEVGRTEYDASADRRTVVVTAALDAVRGSSFHRAAAEAHGMGRARDGSS